jgi:predicted HNH restriction endonuclease
MCGRPAVEVHHKDQLRGTKRFNNPKNKLENLVALCHDCHRKVRERKRAQPAGVPLFDLEPYTVRVI